MVFDLKKNTIKKYPDARFGMSKNDINNKALLEGKKKDSALAIVNEGGKQRLIRI